MFSREAVRRSGSLLPEDDPAFAQVVRGELHFDSVAGEDADEVFAHFAGDDAEDLVVGVVQLELEHRVGQGGGDGCFNFDRLALGHKNSPLDSTNQQFWDGASYGAAGAGTREGKMLSAEC